jgi:hypothetical protein
LHVLSPRNAIEITAWDAASSPRTLEKLASWYWRGTSATRRFGDGFTTADQADLAGQAVRLRRANGAPLTAANLAENKRMRGLHGSYSA